MEKMVISGGKALRGTVRISCGKNSSLAIITAACLAPGVSVLENVPMCRDVVTLTAILEALGARIELQGGRMRIDARQLTTHVAPYELCRQMRASFYTAGLLLGRLQRAQVPLPGGCIIGAPGMPPGRGPTCGICGARFGIPPPWPRMSAASTIGSIFGMAGKGMVISRK